MSDQPHFLLQILRHRLVADSSEVILFFQQKHVQNPLAYCKVDYDLEDPDASTVEITLGDSAVSFDVPSYSMLLEINSIEEYHWAAVEDLNRFGQQLNSDYFPFFLAYLRRLLFIGVLEEILGSIDPLQKENIAQLVDKCRDENDLLKGHLEDEPELISFITKILREGNENLIWIIVGFINQFNKNIDELQNALVYAYQRNDEKLQNRSKAKSLIWGLLSYSNKRKILDGNASSP